MVEAVYSKLDIAREYLDAAIEFYLTQSNFFCAIHLAAAAEELLGAHLSEPQRISTLAYKAEKALKSESGQTVSDKVARVSINEWKNEVKHMADGTNKTMSIDPAFAAEFHIEQALINFYNFGLQKSPAVWKFEDHKTRRPVG
jgi:hypothetical protein